MGGGQLGRMFALVARRCGYRVHLFGDPDCSPAGQISDRVWPQPFDDTDAVREFARSVDVISYEFENIPVDTVRAAQDITAVWPGPRLLEVAQHRIIEKTTLRSMGIPTADSHAIRSGSELTRGVGEFRGGILKTATLGYDGKGQVRLSADSDCEAVWQQLNCREAILEREINFDFEISVVGGRFADGNCTTFAAVRNEHVNHILDLSVSPAPELSAEAAEQARAITVAILEQFDVYGVLCVEFFVTPSGVLVNEIAPRPHNSGHLTIEACGCSQFEQQFRAVCGLPSGDVGQPRPAAMANLLGDHLQHASAERWRQVFAVPGVSVHLYGKADSRAGRKMGHLTCVADSCEAAVRRVTTARELLATTPDDSLSPPVSPSVSR